MEVALVAQIGDVSEPSEVAISALQLPEIALREDDEPEKEDCQGCEILDLYKIPLTALKHATLMNIANGLNGEKLFYTQGLPKYNRDWRGLVDLLALPKPGQISDKAGQVLKAWEKREDATVGKLVECLEAIERWDIIDDNIDTINDDADYFIRRAKVEDFTNNNQEELDELIRNKVFTFEDKERYRRREPMIKYNSLIIYAQAAKDEEFATQMKKTLIDNAENEAERHVCMKLDILPGFMEKDTILELIAERCSYVIVIITPNYGLESPENKFIVNFAQAYSIDQNRRVIIPCIYGGDNVPLPKELKYLSKLDHNRERSMPGYDFWGRLKTSIDTTRADTPDEESFESRKMRLINALPSKDGDKDMYEDMKARELKKKDGPILIEIVEREGETLRRNHMTEVLKKSGFKGSLSDLSEVSLATLPKSQTDRVHKFFITIRKLFKTKVKKRQPANVGLKNEKCDNDDISDQTHSDF